jgi:DNA-binding response OmpR family regulator
VDDEPATVDMLTIYLKMRGYETVAAYSGNDGLLMVEVENPDLLILDLMMPDIDGYEVCSRIRGDGQYQSLPILIVSARTDQSSIKRAMELGADGYLTKPVDLKMLQSEVERLLENPPVHHVSEERPTSST